MTESVILALIGLVGGGGLLGVYIELIRTRRAVGSNGGTSLHDGMRELRTDVREMRTEQAKQGRKIAALEARTGG